jgi:hypothetical protein
MPTPGTIELRQWDLRVDHTEGEEMAHTSWLLFGRWVIPSDDRARERMKVRELEIMG